MSSGRGCDSFDIAPFDLQRPGRKSLLTAPLICIVCIFYVLEIRYGGYSAVPGLDPGATDPI